MSVVQYTAIELATKVAKQTEAAIVEQLQELVSRGLLELQVTQPTFTMNDDGKLHYSQQCRLLLKDQEYIEKLEAENEKLKTKIASIVETFTKLKGEHEIP